MKEYNKIKYLNEITTDSSKAIGNAIFEDLDVYLERLEGTYTYLGQSKNNYLECEIAKEFLVEQIELFKHYEVDNLVFKYLYINKRIYLNKLSILITSIDFSKIIDNMYILIKNIVSKNVFKQYISELKSNTVFLEKAKIYHVTSLINTNIKLIAKEYSPGAKEISNNSFKMIDKIIKGTNVIKGNFNLIDLRWLFYDQDYFPTSKDINEYLLKTLTKNNDNYLVLPLFLKGSSPFFNNKNHGYFQVFYDNVDFFSRLLNLLKEIKSKYTLRIIVPNIMNYPCYLKWQSMIKEIISDSNLLVGMLVDDFDLMDDLVEKGKVECLLIDFEYINNNNFQFKNLNKQKFVDNYLVRLREIRDELNIGKDNLIIKSTSLKCKEVMEKLDILGYKRFVLNKNNF